VDEIIQGYQTKFADLKSAFEGRAVLETEIAVGRVEDAVDRVQSAIRLLDITVTHVLDIASEAGVNLAVVSVILMIFVAYSRYNCPE
jgi:hypothetical protein